MKPDSQYFRTLSPKSPAMMARETEQTLIQSLVRLLVVVEITNLRNLENGSRLLLWVKASRDSRNAVEGGVQGPACRHELLGGQPETPAPTVMACSRKEEASSSNADWLEHDESSSRRNLLDDEGEKRH